MNYKNDYRYQQLMDEDYHEQCKIRCCLPLYCYLWENALVFLRNRTHYAQFFSCKCYST